MCRTYYHPSANRDECVRVTRAVEHCIYYSDNEECSKCATGYIVSANYKRCIKED
ncbi:MAG: hypothetical protein DHS20C13_28470 [Thermodesulfobacteriota bacterium]|nr:MAG: hypothetical protein DHS20C13_28470 [Thermodesulfobacteriota bacterium]